MTLPLLIRLAPRNCVGLLKACKDCGDISARYAGSLKALLITDGECESSSATSLFLLVRRCLHTSPMRRIRSKRD